MLPHQFLGRICPTIVGSIAPGCKAISLIKGIEFKNNEPVLISSMIKDNLGGLDVGVLSAPWPHRARLDLPRTPRHRRTA